MTVVLVIFGLILAFIFFGLIGWVVKGIGVLVQFLFEGCMNSLGCLLWVILAIMLLISLGA